MADSRGSSSSVGAGGYWDEFLNHDDSFYKIINMLDFPMESVEGGDSCFDLEKWNAQFQSLGPVISEILHEVAPVLKSDSMPNNFVQIDPASNTHVSIDSSHPQNRRLFPTPSPNSFLGSSGSCSVRKNMSPGPELLVPVRTRTKIPRSSTFTKWHDQHMPGRRCTHCQAERTPLWREGPMGPKTLCNACGIQLRYGRLVPQYHPSISHDSGNGKIQKNTEMKEKSTHEKMPRCAHCQVTETPQWREGPMGPRILCNACGIRYRSGRLFTEYGPAASRTSVPTLHSNHHNQVTDEEEIMGKNIKPETDP